MKYNTLGFEDFDTKVTCSIFQEKNQAIEFHAILELTNQELPVKKQFENLNQSVVTLFSKPFLKDVSLVWKRYFVSDAANQHEFIQQTNQEAVSVVQQPPLNGSKTAIWVYGIENVQTEQTTDGATLVKRPNYSHTFHTQLNTNEGDSFQQTIFVFTKYMKSLGNFQSSLKSNCIRTWLFIQNVDIRYSAMVKARKFLFKAENLTSQTHYIASTGIEGKYTDPRVTVLMDAYAIPSIKKEQVSFLKGTGYLNPTHEYGVTFERGTVVQFGDRRHVYISGTASIDRNGEIVYPLDIEMQTVRVLENIRVLLSEADCEMNDISYLIIYLRDISDQKVVETLLNTQYSCIPKIILFAPVCRPGWLVEMECMAVKAIQDPRFCNY